MQETQQGMFDSMHPKAAFIFGFISGVAIVSIVILLFVLSGGSTKAAKPTAVRNNPTAAAQPSPSPSGVPVAQAAGDPPPLTDDDHVRGNPDAPVTIIEYSDFECPFCKRFHPTMQQALQEYDGRVKWVYRHFPLGFHDPLATKEAEAVECANELGGNDAFWELTDLIFERTASNGNGLSQDALPKMAAEIGLNESEFSNCLDSGKYLDHVKADMAGGESAGVNGTPGSFVIDEDGNAFEIKGAQPYPSVKAAIEAALN